VKSESSLPPGRTGLPLLGETLAFLKDSFNFIERGVATHGPVFRTHLLGRHTAVITGPEACARWIDQDVVEREGAMPPHVKELFAGDTLPSLDGAAHRTRKQLVLAGFGKSALERYVPALGALIDGELDRWVKQGDVALVPELKTLAIEGICSNMMGLARGPELEALLADYATIGPGLGSLPIALPGTAFSRARKALTHILSVFGEQVAQHRKTPREDGLSRMLAAKAADGTQLSDDDARREMHHVVIAGLIIWAELANAIVQLAPANELRQALREEIAAKLGDGAPTLAKLLDMPLLARVVMEIKRTCPIVPAQFGRAKKDFELGGFTIPKGWMVLWAVHSTNQFAPAFAEPARFDPDRFAAPRAEHTKHAHTFSPQGPGPAEGHRCPGLDYATLFISLFVVSLVRSGARWELAAKPTAYRWNMIPPEPTDGLRVTFHAHAS
jgi:cytochrome P450